MSMSHAKFVIPLALLGGLPAIPAAAETPFFFSTGDPDGKIATATRPDVGAFEIESADDFALTHVTSITGATFTGLMPVGASPEDVVVEIYRVFPNDSNIGRTSGSPTFSTSQVPTRVNSPSDVAFDSRDSASGGLNFATSGLGSLTAANSVTPGGIHPDPGFHTGGNGSATGEETVFTVTLTTPFLLPADHYFFVPQVQLDDGDFLWLSAPKPIVAPGTSFAPDLQSWTRDETLDQDWLRVGTDIVGGATPPTFDAAFSLTGTSVPEPSSMLLVLAGLALLGRRVIRVQR